MIFLVISNSVRQSSKSFCSWITVISNSICGEHSLSVPPSSCRFSVISLSEYSTAGGPSAWLSGVSLPNVILSGPSDVNKARFCGISHRLSLCIAVSSGIRSPAGRPPALRLRPLRPVFLYVTQTRIRFASPVLSTPSDLREHPLM